MFARLNPGRPFALRDRHPRADELAGGLPYTDSIMLNWTFGGKATVGAKLITANRRERASGGARPFLIAAKKNRRKTAIAPVARHKGRVEWLGVAETARLTFWA